MPVSETRLAVNLVDNASAGLNSLNSTYGRFAATIQNSGNQLAAFNRQITKSNFTGFAGSADKAAGSLQNMNRMMERLVYSASRYFVIYKALGSVGTVWDTLVGGSYEYAKSLETNQIGIAGILKSMITLNGESVKWNQAMAISGQAMKSLQSEALRTAATSKELIETFRALLGPGLSSGMSIDQIVKLSTVGTNAVRSLGLPTNQYVQELRSIITEGIRPASSTLATSLGITNKDIKAAKQSAEGLYSFLMKRMEGFADAVKYTSGTVEGRMARIQEGLQVAGAKGADALYKSWSATLEKIANYLIPVPEKLGEKWEVNPSFVKSIESIAKTVGNIASSVADVAEEIAPLVGFLGKGSLSAISTFTQHLGAAIKMFAAVKLAPILADMARLVTSTREGYEAQTAFGRVLQGVSDKLHGRTAEMQRLIATQQGYNAVINEFFADVSRSASLDAMIKQNANSITNLAAKWQKLGMDAKQAGGLQSEILSLFKAGLTQTAHELIEYGDTIAQNIQRTNQYKKAVEDAFNAETRAIDRVISAQSAQKKTAKEIYEARIAENEAQAQSMRQTVEQSKRVEAAYQQELRALRAINAEKKKSANDVFRSFHGSVGVTSDQEGAVSRLIDKMRQLGMAEKDVVGVTEQFIAQIKKGGQDAHALADKYITSMTKVKQQQEELIAKEAQSRTEAERTNKVKIENAETLIAKMKELGMTEEQAYVRANQYLQAVEKGGLAAGEAIMKEVQASNERFAVTQRSLGLKREEITIEKQLAIEESAYANARRVSGVEAEQALRKNVAGIKELIAQMQQKGMVTKEVEEQLIALLNLETNATKQQTDALNKSLEAWRRRTEEANRGTQTSIQKFTTLTSTIGGLSMGIGILCDFMKQADDKNKEWYESAGSAAMQAGMFAMAIGSISTAIADMIPYIAKGIEWLNKFAMAKLGAGLGTIGAVAGVAAGVGAVVYNAYTDYEKNHTATAVDEFTGEVVSHKFGGIDDADSYAIVNDSTYDYATKSIAPKASGNIGLQFPASGGGSKGGGGGSSKANKAEEYAARMKKIVEDLNKELTNMRGNATAYEKAMAAAKDKIAGYEKEIVKAEQLGVDITEVRAKQEEYLVAARKKAVELQEDENLKYMKLEEERANRINTLGEGTVEYQRYILNERLQAHKEYLEELLAADIDNKERRYQLEAELASVVKQINENSVYEFKEGWRQALEELANQQTNFKESATSLFGSIENSLVDLVSGADSASNKFKKFCQDVTNTILKSMTQIIIKGLITKAIMAAIGMATHGVSIPSGTGVSLGSVSDTWAGGGFEMPTFHASGGNVKAGELSVVGEQGPELVRFNKSGTVYNAQQTRSMMSNSPQNVKIELINESGQELKTENASVKFDLDTMVISAVIKGVNNNTMGMRTMLKGLAAT